MLRGDELPLRSSPCTGIPKNDNIFLWTPYSTGHEVLSFILKEITEWHKMKSISILWQWCWNYTPKLELRGIRAGKTKTQNYRKHPAQTSTATCQVSLACL